MPNCAALDADILAKLSERARCAQEVGEVKKAEEGENIVFYRPERERQVLARVAALKQFGHSVRTPPKCSIADVFKAVETGACNYGIVPVESSTEAMVVNPA